MTSRRALLLVGAALFLVAGTEVVWIDWTGIHPQIDGVRVELVARFVWFLGFLFLVIDDVRKIFARRRARHG